MSRMGGRAGLPAGPAMRHGVMLEMNAALVLDHVRARGESTRPEIAAALGLSAATVSRIVRRLIDEGRIVEVPGASTGGRPRSTIRFNPLAGCVIGVDLGLVIPDGRKSLRDGAIKPMQTPAWKECQDDLMRYAAKAGIPRDLAWNQLSEAEDRKSTRLNSSHRT